MAKRSKSELEEILTGQLYLLNKSCKEYDNGDEIEVIRISGHLRTLLHQTSKSTPLLELLGLRSSLTMYDTAVPKGAFGGFKILSGSSQLMINRAKSNFYAGLVCKEIQGNRNNINVLRCSAQLEPSFLNKKITFKDWWDNNIVFDDGLGNTLNRKDIVTLIANKDGYSHVDDNPPQKYLIFKNSNVVQFNLNGQLTSPKNIPIYPAVRQIAFEFINSFTEQYSQYKV